MGGRHTRSAAPLPPLAAASCTAPPQPTLAPASPQSAMLVRTSSGNTSVGECRRAVSRPIVVPAQWPPQAANLVPASLPLPRRPPQPVSAWLLGPAPTRCHLLLRRPALPRAFNAAGRCAAVAVRGRVNGACLPSLASMRYCATAQLQPSPQPCTPLQSPAASSPSSSPTSRWAAGWPGC